MMPPALHRGVKITPRKIANAVAIVDGDAERAIGELRAAGSGVTPVLQDEAHLQRLAISLPYTWGLVTEALPLIEFTAERYPESAQAQAMLAESYVLAENYAAAIEVLERYVQQHPNNPGALARLEQVRQLEGQGRQ
jgi:predicted Zn-dependent protease